MPEIGHLPDVRPYLRRRTSVLSSNNKEHTMIPRDTYLVLSEMEYRKDRTRKGIAAQRGSRSRSSWIRRVANAEKSI